jgi:hypothetical protein
MIPIAYTHGNLPDRVICSSCVERYALLDHFILMPRYFYHTLEGQYCCACQREIKQDYERLSDTA